MGVKESEKCRSEAQRGWCGPEEVRKEMGGTWGLGTPAARALREQSLPES